MGQSCSLGNGDMKCTQNVDREIRYGSQSTKQQAEEQRLHCVCSDCAHINPTHSIRRYVQEAPDLQRIQLEEVL